MPMAASHTTMTATITAMQQTGAATRTLASEVATGSVRGLTISTGAAGTTRLGATRLRAAGLSAAAISTAMAALTEYTTAPTMSTGSALRATARSHSNSHQEEQATENRFHRRESLTDQVEIHLLGGAVTPCVDADSHRPIKAMFQRPDPRTESAEDIACSRQRSFAGLISCIDGRSRTIQKFDTTGLDTTISILANDKSGKLARL